MIKAMRYKVFFILLFVILGYIIYHFISKNITGTKKGIIIEDISTFNNKVKNSTIKNMPPIKELAGYGIRLFDKNGEIYPTPNISVGKEGLKCYVSLANLNPHSDRVGFMIFVDGIMQEFTIDGEKQKNLQYFQNMKPYSLVNVPIDFQPIVSSKAQKHEIWFVYTYLLDKKVGVNNEHIPYFATRLKYNLNVDSEYTLRKAYINNAYVGNIKPNLIEKDVWKCAIGATKSINQIYQQTKIQLAKDTINDLWIEATTQKPGEYITYFFVDDKPSFLLNNKNYMTWTIDKNQMLSQKLKFKTSKSDTESQFYTLTIPLSGEENMILESEKTLIQIRD